MATLHYPNPCPWDSPLPQRAFQRDQQARLTALRDELFRSSRRLVQLAAHYGPDGGKYDLAEIVEQFRGSLLDGTVENKQEVIRLLVDQVLVDRNGQMDIQAKFPFE